MHDITLADSIAEETDGSSEHWAGAALAKASAAELGVLWPPTTYIQRKTNPRPVQLLSETFFDFPVQAVAFD